MAGQGVIKGHPFQFSLTHLPGRYYAHDAMKAGRIAIAIQLNAAALVDPFETAVGAAQLIFAGIGSAVIKQAGERNGPSGQVIGRNALLHLGALARHI